MIHYKIPSYEYLQQVIVPVTIFHGTSDGIIPYSNAQKLQPFLKPTDQFITIEGGSHNDLNDYPLYHQKLDSLLKIDRLLRKYHKTRPWIHLLYTAHV